MTLTVSVSNGAQLLAALKNATGGEKIVLNAGDYGSIDLSAKHFASEVILTSADPGHMATLKGLNLSDVTNLKFDDLNFKFDSPTGTPVWASPFRVSGSSGITFTNSSFHGDTAKGVDPSDNGYGTGNGLAVRDSQNITITHNSFENFQRGLTVGNVKGVVVSGNDVSNISSDGMDFSAVTNAAIDSNHIHDFHRSPSSTAHPDMIQFWTQGTHTPSSNVVISNNLLDQGTGVTTQSIFMRNEMVDQHLANSSMFYQNVTITNNIIRNSSHHGITVGETNGLNINHNTIVQEESLDQGGIVSVPTINIAASSLGVSVTDNIVPSLTGSLTSGGTGWNIQHNLVATIDDPNSANYIGKMFYDALGTGTASLADFHTIKGSAADLGHYGAHSASVGYYGYIDNHQAGGTLMTSPHQVFDVSQIFDAQGKLATANAQVSWDFGDGTRGSGLFSDHAYSSTGTFTASAFVSLQNGTHLEVQKTLKVVSPNLLDANFNTSFNDQSAEINAVTVNKAVLVATLDGGHAVNLNGGTVKYHADAGFENNKEFTLTVDFKKFAGQEKAGGTLAFLSGGYNITVVDDHIVATLNTTKGAVKLVTGNVGLHDTAWHRVALVFSGVDGSVNLLVDGHNVAKASGLVGAVQNHGAGADFHIGNPFGGSFVGLVDNLHLSNTALSVNTLSTGALATPHSEFAALSAFDPAMAFAPAHQVSLYSEMHSVVAFGPPTHDFLLI